MTYIQKFCFIEKINDRIRKNYFQLSIKMSFKIFFELIGMSLMKILKSLGDKTAPCGTPLVML